MSGTSLDGIDAALVEFIFEKPIILATHWQPYSPSIKHRALALQTSGSDEIHQAATLSNSLAAIYAETVHAVLAKAETASTAITAIGCHGQTVRHQPNQGYSLQLNNPSLLAEITKIAVVADFRSRDISAGGQGAPLVPSFHSEVFSQPDQHNVILNIGGFANLTDLNPVKPVRGFDCGPGNVLMDAWIEANLGLPYDKDGQWAAQGKVLPGLLNRLLDTDFFHLTPPKSCGREEFHLAWLEQFLDQSESAEDVQATLAELTAVSSAQAIIRWCGKPLGVYVCGGGLHNMTLMRRLQHYLPRCLITSTELLGQPPDWVEAVAFAWLARRTVNGLVGNLPAVTGASGSRILGAIYPV
jgi:anhydro-N-acetylmuramic acid kinase